MPLESLLSRWIGIIPCLFKRGVDMALTLIGDFLRELLAYLYANISSIPFSISIGAALLLTVMYIASLISSALIKMLLIPAWIFALVTYFFPTLVPREYEVLSLLLFAFMVGIAAVMVKIRSKRLGKTRMDKAISEMLKWMRESHLINPETRLSEQYIQYRLKEILKKNKLY